MTRRLVLLAAAALAFGSPAAAQVQLTLVRDVRPGPQGSAPWRIGAMGDTLLFMADSSGAGGPEVWGTAGGTAWRVLTPPDTSIGQPRVLGRLGNDLYLVVGGALWRTDGVTADTVHTGVTSARLFPPCGGGYPAAALDDRLVFAAGFDCTIWAVDRDSSWQVADPSEEEGPAGLAQHIFRVGSDAYIFWGFASGTGRSIWRTSGAPADHVMALDPEPDTTARPWTAAGLWEGSLYFESNRGGTGEEMWQWSGAGAPTLLGDLVPGAGGSSPARPFAALGRLWFLASEATTGVELRSWDGTSITTPFEVAPGPGPGPEVSQLGHREAAGKLYFWVRTGNDISDTYELHSWDATTHRVITTGLAANTFHEAGHVVGAGGRAWFDGCAVAGASGASLWSTDGVTAEVAAAGSPDVCTDARPFMAMAESDGALLARVDDPGVGIEPFIVRYTGIVEAPGSPYREMALETAPNPVRDRLAVVLELPAGGPATVVLFDATGRGVVTLHEGTLAAGGHRLSLDAAGLSPGIYFLRADTPAGTATRVVTIAR